MRFDNFKQIDHYYTSKVSPGEHYDQKLTYKVTRSQMQIALRTAIRLANQPYSLTFNSCTTILQLSLHAAEITDKSIFNPLLQV